MSRRRTRIVLSLCALAVAALAVSPWWAQPRFLGPLMGGN